MAKERTSLLDFVPDALRRNSQRLLGFDVSSQDIEATIRSLVPVYLAEEGIEPGDAMIFTLSAMSHQALLGDDDVRYIKARIVEVEMLTKGDKGGELPGKKARIHFVNQDGEDEHLDTDLLESNYDRVSAYKWWPMAMARTIAKQAEDGIGKDAILTKHTYAISDTAKARQIIDINIIWRSGDDNKDKDDDKGGRRGSSRSSRKSDDDSSSRSSSRGSSSRGKKEEDSSEDDSSSRKSRRTKSIDDQVDDALEKYDTKEVLKDSQIDKLIKLLTKTKDEDAIIEWLAEELDIEEDEAEKLSEVEDIVGFTVDAFVKGLKG